MISPSQFPEFESWLEARGWTILRPRPWEVFAAMNGTNELSIRSAGDMNQKAHILVREFLATEPQMILGMAR